MVYKSLKCCTMYYHIYVVCYHEVWYHVIWYATMCYGIIKYDTMWCDIICCIICSGMIWCGMFPWSVVLCEADLETWNLEHILSSLLLFKCHSIIFCIMNYSIHLSHGMLCQASVMAVDCTYLRILYVYSQRIYLGHVKLWIQFPGCAFVTKKLSSYQHSI